MAGGLNDKTPEAAAVWRQGNLLEFGFEVSPGQMNETGRTLLANAIVYIARFTQDRPILKVPMTASRRLVLRQSLLRWLTQYSPETVEDCLTKETIAAAPGRDTESYKHWLPTVLPYLYPDATLKYQIDKQAQALSIRFDQPDFPAKAIAAWRSGGAGSDAARTLLQRYIPEGPIQAADVNAWERWIQQNGPYIFFSESGGLRWYIDPLAKKRQVPTSKLRGPARADKIEK